jgi:HEAT repeat protein
MEQDSAKITKLQNLKTEVKANYTTVTFTTPGDLAYQVAEAIQSWTQENAACWKAMERMVQPLSEREKEFIDTLHQDDDSLVKRAIRALKNLQSRSALEHFYALLLRSNTPRSIKKDILEALDEFKDNDRALDALIAATDAADASVRSFAALRIGERAVLNGVLTVAALEALERLASDRDDEVREETAHALGKIGSRYRDFAQQCAAMLMQLERDPAPDVSNRAKNSLRLCRQNP